MKLRIYTDGGARGNPGPAAVGVVVCDGRDKVIFEHNDCIGNATNNIAEYCALIAGLEIAKRLKAKEVECFMDSELLANQLSGNYKIKADHIRTLYDHAKKTAAFFKSVTYHHRRRETPMLRHADRLVNDALDHEQRDGL